ncbi:PLP-dependent enzyme, glutamate decarboxylase [Actinoalloteichus sp. GBA129-24]|uniref:PLP-dependent enzyme, glutamate decarboxylase n=2 Tax=Pseudonocardiaceae TaxID=2070 RepID=A0AAC9PS46_9PSEU|nr:PLP-dependent enzyme, glutamate decarboxylase [Actinoalloteichus fjordicus]APU20435.1 PLP-dependent enzyme, glutamate decarboxylase [Actinoalloteichus sp. GBA129-24]
MTQTLWSAPPESLGHPPPLAACSPADMLRVINLMTAGFPGAGGTDRSGPLPAGPPAQVSEAVAAALGPARLSEDGLGAAGALRLVTGVLVDHGLNLTHPGALAHLQPAPLPVAVAADVFASLGNASLDTYDSGPSAVAVERWLIRLLTGLAGLTTRADGVLTPGGSLSNLMALLLARDAAAARRGIDVRRSGVASLPGPVVFCSELAHFSVHRACAVLGLGEDAVRPVPVDGAHRLRPEALAAMLRELPPENTPIAVVATAGTTDFGSVDPLPELAEITSEHGLWLHVDAAYGFGTLFSDRLSSRLRGIELADSITGDLHKLGWQPASASVLLLAEGSSFTPLHREVAYLNPADDTAAGFGGLLGQTLQTTRRPDAVKIATTLLALGRGGLGTMVEDCHDLARHAAGRVEDHPRLRLVGGGTLTTVVFRFQTVRIEHSDLVNSELRRRLSQTGGSLLGRTTARDEDGTERTCLKLTFLNPATTPDQVDEVLAEVLAAGAVVEAEMTEEIG